MFTSITAFIRRASTLIIIAAFILVGTFTINLSTVHAATTWTVTTTVDDAAVGTCSTTCTLRDALNSAQNGDTIQFQSGVTGTITLGTAGTLNVTTSVTINGPGASNLIIDGSADDGNVIFIVNPVTASISGLTVAHGTGGGIYSVGGILNRGMLTISNSIFSGNSAGLSNGGGIYNTSGGTLAINNSTFSGNSAGGYYLGGGGIYNAGVLTVNNSTFSGNMAGVTGAGVYNDGNATLTVNNSTFSNNSDNDAGGGIFNAGSIAVRNSTFSGNSAGFSLLAGANEGGALYISTYGSAIVSNSTFSNNLASSGGGIFSTGSLHLLSDIVAKNTASHPGPDINNSGTMTSLGYNLIGDGTGSGITAATGDQIGTSANPIDPLLSALANNGGSILTMALTSASPAYKKGYCGGNNTVTPVAPAVTTDQRGQPRKGLTTGCDAGAYEVQPIVPVIDSIGIYRAGTFYLRLHNTQGFADITVAFNPSGKNLPVVGDWAGVGFDTIGVFNQNTGNFTLCNANVTATCANVANQIKLTLGNPSDTPLAGRWQLSATHAGAGVYRPSNGVLYLKNALTTGFADNAMVMGLPGDKGIAGDWTGKGFDSPGVFRPSGINLYLSNQVTNGPVFADITVTYGSASDLPIVGDWIAQGHDGVGMFRLTNGSVYLKNALTTGFADTAFFYGLAGDQPVAGHWQAVYPPAPPAPILIAKTAIPQSSNRIAPGDNQIGG